jgi:hypothetical protein
MTSTSFFVFAALAYVISLSSAEEQQGGLLCDETSLMQVEQLLHRRDGDGTADQKDSQGYDPNTYPNGPPPVIDNPQPEHKDWRPDHTSESWPNYPTGYQPFGVGKGGEMGDAPIQARAKVKAVPQTRAQTRGQIELPRPILTADSITWEYNPGQIAFDGTYNGFHWLVEHMPGPKNKYKYYLDRGDLYFQLNDDPPKAVPKLHVQQKNRAPMLATVLKTWPIGADPAFEALPYETAGIASFKDSESSEVAQFINAGDRHTVVSKLHALCHRVRMQSCVIESSWPHDSTNLGDHVPRSAQGQGGYRMATHGAGSKSVQLPRSSRDHSRNKLATHGAGSKSVSGHGTGRWAQTNGGFTYAMYSAARWPSTGLLALAVALTVGSSRDLLL